MSETTGPMYFECAESESRLWRNARSAVPKMRLTVRATEATFDVEAGVSEDLESVHCRVAKKLGVPAKEVRQTRLGGFGDHWNCGGTGGVPWA